MTATSHTEPLPAQATGKRLQSSAVHQTERGRRRALVAREPVAIRVMGAANTPPGVPAMGAPTQSLHPAMGWPDTGPRVSAMGAGDQGPRIELFGESARGFVDSLFAPLRATANKETTR